MQSEGTKDYLAQLKKALAVVCSKRPISLDVEEASLVRNERLFGGSQEVNLDNNYRRMTLCDI
jgi:hypothetical protein